jgi:hypothetical protein
MCARRPGGHVDGMLNPLSLPADVLAALRSVSNIERILDDRLAEVERQLRDLDRRIELLPADLERRLRPHLEAQNEAVERLHPELVANRKHAEKLPGKVDGLREELRAVRETTEPLQGPAERVARLSERLPGGG